MNTWSMVSLMPSGHIDRGLTADTVIVIIDPRTLPGFRVVSSTERSSPRHGDIEGPGGTDSTYMNSKLKLRIALRTLQFKDTRTISR